MGTLHVFPWNENLETGIELVDEQHKNFLKHANEYILRIMASKASPENNPNLERGAEKQFEFLHDYLQYHFQAEETFMADSNWPGYREHQAIHNQLKFKVKALEQVMISGTKKQRMDGVTQLVEEWIVDHILNEDQKFADYYKERKKAMAAAAATEEKAEA